MKYQAVAIKNGIWVLLSTPCSKKIAEQFNGCECRGEVFTVKTEEEVKQHKNVLK